MNEMIQRARTIQEKSKAYQGNVMVDYDYLKEWRSTRTLLNDKHFHEMLDGNDMTEEEFAYSLQPEMDMEKQEGDEWYEVFIKILEGFSDSEIDAGAGVGIPALPFSIYFKCRIKCVIDNLHNIKITNNALEAFVQSHVEEMFGITGKLIALKLAIYKEHHKFRAKDEKAQLAEFLKDAFGSKSDFYKFYEDYPVAARVATVRTMYLLKNYSNILMHIDADHEEIKRFLGCKSLKLTDVVLSVGDSHAQGNSVSILKFREKKLVYKPKDLRINQAFEAFVDWYAKKSGLLDVRLPKGIYKDSYSYNEYVGKKCCRSEKEVERFYTRYGYLVAICYLLNINDLHLENVVAHGEYPVIVDMETLFQVPALIGEKSAFYNLAKYLELDSVACSLLLPKQIHVGAKDVINLSAFNGTQAELSQEILVPKNVNTVDFHYGNVKGHFAGGDNIPQYGEDGDVDVSKYGLVVLDAFEEFMKFIMNHKEEALKALEAFKGKKVRALLKSTERYAFMLRYANHPNYNSDMKYRERLMMNIWAYPYRDKRIIKSEVRDLLFNDIPIFFAYTDSRDVIDSQGISYARYHEVSGYEVVRKKIVQLSDKAIGFQKNIVMLSLGIMDPYLNGKVGRFGIAGDAKKVHCIRQAESLSDKVMSKAYEVGGECTFINLDCDRNRHWGLCVCDLSLYGGLSGIAVVYLELYRMTKEGGYLDCYQKLMKTAVKQTKNTTFESAFTGWLSPVYPMILEKIYFNSVCDLAYLKKTAKHLNEATLEQLNKIQYHDYISGFAGIIRLLKLTRKYLPELGLSDAVIDKFVNLTYERSREEFENGEAKAGIAHGISGIAYGLVSAGGYDRAEIKEMLDYEYHIEVDSENDYKWCWGYSGMIQARLAINHMDSGCINKRQLHGLIKKFEKMLDKALGSDTLCHGNGSIVTTLRMLYNETKDGKWKKYLEMWLADICMSALYGGYKVSKVGEIESKGVFDGIYGVVWMYLYAAGNINNILLLETEAE